MITLLSCIFTCTRLATFYPALQKCHWRGRGLRCVAALRTTSIQYHFVSIIWPLDTIRNPLDILALSITPTTGSLYLASPKRLNVWATSDHGKEQLHAGASVYSVRLYSVCAFVVSRWFDTVRMLMGLRTALWDSFGLICFYRLCIFCLWGQLLQETSQGMPLG